MLAIKYILGYAVLSISKLFTGTVQIKNAFMPCAFSIYLVNVNWIVKKTWLNAQAIYIYVCVYQFLSDI
jgi:peptidoglycan biosynthesis protein MviN/MurJ (putative lipid II flippase)